MPDRVLTLRELNRATLQRQMLLERVDVSVPEAIERLVALQAQVARPPYIGLWTRLNRFKREDLTKLIEDHTVIKATFLRATLHLLTAADYLRFRATIQPVLEGASASIVESRGVAFDREAVLEATRSFITEKPRTFAAISDMLSERWPETDIGAMRYTARTHIPLVQVPNSSTWSYPATPEFTLAETWLGKLPDDEDRFRELVKRYLAAFGPAGVTDVQSWSGLGKLKAAIEAMKPELQVYRDENRREHYDLPDTTLPDADTPAPPRFLPEFDNLLLSHSNRTRVIADEHRSKVYLPGLRVAATILLDGFVAGVWKIEKVKKSAALVIEPFAALNKKDRAALEEEGEQLVRFAEPDAQAYEVKFAGE